MFSLALERQRDQRSNCQHPLDHRKNKRTPEKHLLLLHWLWQSLWLCGSQQTGKFLKRWESWTSWPASWEICMQVKKQQLELDTEQQTGSKSGKEYVKAAYCHPAYLTYVQSSVQFSSVAQSCPTLCDPMNRSAPGLPVHHQLPDHEKCWTRWSTSWNQDCWEKYQ